MVLEVVWESLFVQLSYEFEIQKINIAHQTILILFFYLRQIGVDQLVFVLDIEQNLTNIRLLNEIQEIFGFLQIFRN